MSLEQAKALIDRMRNDEKFRNRIFSIEEMDDRMRTISDAGYSCTIEEIQQINEGENCGDISAGSLCWTNFCFN
ncbi:MAG: Nif11-like leader peptide family natural product precursor [Chlorobiaceae bacterium]|nr:Nif11-like leader peptide family natural product precursor [Chlorobiaceae bacterium]